MNVTHNTSTCKSESIKIIRFIDIFNINKVPSLFRYNHPTTSGRVNLFFYTSTSQDLWFLHYFAKSHKFQKLFIIFNARTLLELLSSGLTLCSSIRINENNNNQKFTNARLIDKEKQKLLQGGHHENI
jgi:hypothetical protein